MLRTARITAVLLLKAATSHRLWHRTRWATLQEEDAKESLETPSLSQLRADAPSLVRHVHFAGEVQHWEYDAKLSFDSGHRFCTYVVTSKEKEVTDPRRKEASASKEVLPKASQLNTDLLVKKCLEVLAGNAEENNKFSSRDALDYSRFDNIDTSDSEDGNFNRISGKQDQCASKTSHRDSEEHEDDDEEEDEDEDEPFCSICGDEMDEESEEGDDDGSKAGQTNQRYWCYGDCGVWAHLDCITKEPSKYTKRGRRFRSMRLLNVPGIWCPDCEDPEEDKSDGRKRRVKAPQRRKR